MAEPAAPQPAADSALPHLSVQRFNLSRKIKYSINGNLPTGSRPSLASRQEGPSAPELRLPLPPAAENGRGHPGGAQPRTAHAAPSLLGPASAVGWGKGLREGCQREEPGVPGSSGRASGCHFPGHAGVETLHPPREGAAGMLQEPQSPVGSAGG